MIRKLFLFLSAVLILGALATVTLPYWFPYQSYKPQIEEQISDLTHRQVTLGDHVALRFWPHLALGVNGVTIGAPDNSDAPHFAQVERAAIAIALKPLLTGTVQVIGVTLDAPVLYIEKNLPQPEGTSTDSAAKTVANSWDFLQKETPSPEASQANSETMVNLAVDQVHLTDATVIYRDYQGQAWRADNPEQRVVIDRLTVDMQDVKGPYDIKARLRAKTDWPVMDVIARIGALAEAPLPVDITVSSDALKAKMQAEGTVTLPSEGVDLGLAMAVSADLRSVAALSGLMAREAALPDIPLTASGQIQGGMTAGVLRDVTLSSSDHWVVNGDVKWAETAPISVTLEAPHFVLEAVQKMAPATPSGTKATTAGHNKPLPKAVATLAKLHQALEGVRPQNDDTMPAPSGLLKNGVRVNAKIERVAQDLSKLDDHPLMRNVHVKAGWHPAKGMGQTDLQAALPQQGRLAMTVSPTNEELRLTTTLSSSTPRATARGLVLAMGKSIEDVNLDSLPDQPFSQVLRVSQTAERLSITAQDLRAGVMQARNATLVAQMSAHDVSALALTLVGAEVVLPDNVARDPNDVAAASATSQKTQDLPKLFASLGLGDIPDTVFKIENLIVKKGQTPTASAVSLIGKLVEGELLLEKAEATVPKLARISANGDIANLVALDGIDLGGQVSPLTPSQATQVSAAQKWLGKLSAPVSWSVQGSLQSLTLSGRVPLSGADFDVAGTLKNPLHNRVMALKVSGQHQNAQSWLTKVFEAPMPEALSAPLIVDASLKTQAETPLPILESATIKVGETTNLTAAMTPPSEDQRGKINLVLQAEALPAPKSFMPQKNGENASPARGTQTDNEAETGLAKAWQQLSAYDGTIRVMVGSMPMTEAQSSRPAEVVRDLNAIAELRDGVMTVSDLSAGIGEAGKINGKMRMTAQELTATTAMTQVDMAAIMQGFVRDTSKPQRLQSGLLTGDVALTVAQPLVAEPLARTNALGEATLQNLVVVGTDIDRMAQNLDRANSVDDALRLLQGLKAGGTTAFQPVATPFEMSRGILQIPEVTAVTAQNLAAVTTRVKVDFVKDALDLRGQLRFINERNMPPLGVTVTGSLSAPQPQLDQQALVRFIGQRAVQSLTRKLGEELLGGSLQRNTVTPQQQPSQQQTSEPGTELPPVEQQLQPQQPQDLEDVGRQLLRGLLN